MVYICNFNKFGFCKFKEYCKYLHLKEICEDKNCEIVSCDKRHPKKCFYFENYGRCKFGEYCMFKHEDSMDLGEKERERLTVKIKELETDIEDKIAKLSVLENEREEKENKIQRMKYDLDEKDRDIGNLKAIILNRDEGIRRLEKETSEKNNKIRTLQIEIHHLYNTRIPVTTTNYQRHSSETFRKDHAETIPQFDGLDASLAESTSEESNSLTRLMNLTEKLGEFSSFR